MVVVCHFVTITYVILLSVISEIMNIIYKLEFIGGYFNVNSF